MAGKTKNEHYIPQSYLNRFAENGKITVYLREKDILLNDQDPRNFAAKRYYYDTNPEELKELLEETLTIYPEYRDLTDWDDPQFIEHAFSRSEADAKNVLDEIMSNPEKLTEDTTRAKIIIFLHDLAYRVEYYRDTQEYINKKTSDVLSKMNLPDGSQEYIKKTFGPDRGKQEQLSQITNTSAVLYTAKKLLTEYEWYWGEAQGDGELIISDDPLLNLKIESSEIVFPVSRVRAIILRKTGVKAPIMGTDEPQDGIIKISVSNVVRYNLLQLCWMRRYAFGSERILKLMTKLWNTRDELREK